MSSADTTALDRFVDADIGRPLLGLVYGRRRIGKSTLLVNRVGERSGFYFEATRAESPVQLDRLGLALGEYLGVGRIALSSWEEAIRALLNLGEKKPTLVVLDEFGHIIESDPSIESLLAVALGPNEMRHATSRCRLILCGSAVAMMRALSTGEAPLRGRAGLELVMQPDDFRVASTRLSANADFDVRVRVFSVIGGVVGYATDMVNFDLPTTSNDFARWVTERVLSPSSTLLREASTLLSEDPALGGRSALLHHSILGAIANGSITAGEIAKRVGRPVANIDPVLRRLIESGFVVRHEDPIRKHRPMYALADPFLQFHYAVIEPHGAALRSRDLMVLWNDRLGATFNSQVRGPVFEEMARQWILKFASDETINCRDHIGPSIVRLDGVSHEIDLVVAKSGSDPVDRTVVALGEAKSGETLTTRHLKTLNRIRDALGTRASHAKLFLFGQRFDDALQHAADARSDVELVDLERLYFGS